MSQQLLNSEAIVTELDISHLVIEDDTPVDNFESEEHQRLLVEPLYSSKALPPPFLAAANVGLFYKLYGDPIVPDVLLSLGVHRPADYSQKRNRSYFVWEFGKVPEVCIEIVSNQEGDELVLSRKSQQKGKEICKKDIYAQIGVPYYVVFDPLRQIQASNQMDGALLRVWTLTSGEYIELPSSLPSSGVLELNQPNQPIWMKKVGLGLTLWEGQFEEEVTRLWLRWCDRDGQVIPTGAERANNAENQVDIVNAQLEQERQKNAVLIERLRQMGINPDELT
jgi:Uma2 family endonuclease